MCKIFNSVGSLTTLKSYLENCNIHDFKSIKEVIDFQKAYHTSRLQIIYRHETLIEQEKKCLEIDLQNVEKSLEEQRQESEKILTCEIEMLKEQLNICIENKPENLFQKAKWYLRQRNYKRKIRNKENNYIFEVRNATKELAQIHQSKNDRHEFITSNFSQAVKQSSEVELSELDRKKTIIDKLNPFIYGAIGEHKVVKTLEDLPDEYILINDFSLSFSPAIYNRQENDYIKSVQIDHILVSPSGVFLIETKNWSEKSLENLSLRSPVDQIKRSNFALFKLLNNEMSNLKIHLAKHHWGDKKISIKNLIVLTNTKPKEEFQYVKILTLNELPGYIKYFKPIFTSTETGMIADFLLNLNDRKMIRTK